MGILSDAYRLVGAFRFTQVISKFVKNKVTDCVVNYANNLEDSQLTDYMKKHADTENLTAEEESEYLENADALKTFMISSDVSMEMI